MSENINESNKNLKVNYYLNISYNNSNHVLLIDFDTNVSELKEKIYNYFKIDPLKYDLQYKDVKLKSNDKRPIALLFQNDVEKNPYIFLISKETEKKPDSRKAIYTINLFTKIPIKILNKMLDKYFEYKKCPNDAFIKNTIKGIYEIRFRKANMALEFKQYFEINKSKFNNDIIIFPPINRTNKSISTKGGNIKFGDNEIISYKYMNAGQKYYSGKIIEKKNFLYKMGFINNTGKYNINKEYKYVKNYVGATPNLPPILHKFRDIHKSLWIDSKGFFL